MCVCSICSFASIVIAFLMSSIDVYTGMSIVILSECLLMLIQANSWSLLSVWLWWDSKSTMYRFGPGLYKLCMLYWWMCSIMDCSHYDRVVMSLLTIATNGLWSVITFTSLVKQQWQNFSRPCIFWILNLLTFV